MMLYPKNRKPFSLELFQNPTAEYRGAPFWAWNGVLDKEELCRQIEDFKKMGFGGFHMHVRTGLQTEYLGEEFFDMVKACVDKAEQEDMLAWLYDEDRWPSGQAGGLVTKKEEFRRRRLILTPHPLEEGSRCRLLAKYQVRLDDEGYLVDYCRLNHDQSANTGFAYYAYRWIDGDRDWYNGQAEVDTLNPKAMQEFFRVTHEEYASRIGEKFGDLVPAVFTDEPAIGWNRIQPFALEPYEMRFAWTDDLPKTFAAAWSGADIFESLPELVWERCNGNPSQFRYRFHDHVTQRFREAFVQQYGRWCREHGLMFAGHLPEEDTFFGQTSAIGEVMRMYPAFDLPGVDMLSDSRQFEACKQTQSVVRQQGKEGMLSELYGATNWDFDFRGMKQQGDWQATLGVTVRTPHLSWYSMKGEAKRDYPTTFSYQSAWYEDYSLIEDHFARLNTALTRGTGVVRVGVIHPIESYWMHWGAKNHTQSKRDAVETKFRQISQWLLENTIDFDYICESTLPEQCAVSDVSSHFPVGNCRYDVILVPGCEMLRGTTLDRLEAFRSNGGAIIFLGDAPVWSDGAPSDRGLRLYNMSRKLPFDKTAVLDALVPYREVSVVDRLVRLNRISNVPTDILHQLRQDADTRWLFLAQSQRNKDMPVKRCLQIKIKGNWIPVLFDTIHGTVKPLEYTHFLGHTVTECTVYNHDSVLLRLLPEGADPLLSVDDKRPVQPARAISFTSSVPVTLEEPNVLLLDMAQYAFDDEPWQPSDEILRISELIRNRLGGRPSAGGEGIQPWVYANRETPHKLKLRYTFNSEITVENTYLALEDAERATVFLNGVPANELDGWFVDRSIQRVKLPTIAQGENVLEIQYPWGVASEAEASYVLGDFGVRTAGCCSTLTSPVKKLAFGDITTQGLPFYGGNLTYHLPVTDIPLGAELNVSFYKGAVVRVAVDGEPIGSVCFAPYCMSLPELSGDHVLNITCVGNRFNTFGQLHCVPCEGTYWDPGSWRTTGDRWSYEYQLRPQGILKAPEIIINAP